MSEQEFKPFVPADSQMREFTVRALLLGLLMCVILGAANAYLGLKAGMTIAATYPAAVIGMAVLRIFKGSLLEENFARTVGSIGESVAAGAIFTIPAFVILNMWQFKGFQLSEYLTATALMIVGGILGILFVTILRRVMVEDQSLPFPESVAASEIHKAGQRGADAAMQLFKAMGIGAADQAPRRARGLPLVERLPGVGRKVEGELRPPRHDEGREDDRGRRRHDALGARRDARVHRRRLHHRPRARRAELRGRRPLLGAVRSAPRLLPRALAHRLVPRGHGGRPGAGLGAPDASDLYRYIVKPIAVGGMLVGACYTLFRMRKNLMIGIKRGVQDVQKSAAAAQSTKRTEKDLSFKTVLMGIGLVFLLMIALYFYFTQMISRRDPGRDRHAHHRASSSRRSRGTSSG